MSGSRTLLGEATLADLELARQEIRSQALKLAHWKGWLELIAPKLAAGRPSGESSWTSFAPCATSGGPAEGEALQDALRGRQADPDIPPDQ